MKMLIERYTISIVLLISLVAIGIQMFLQNELAFYIPLFAVVLSLIYTIRIRNRIQRLSKMLIKGSSTPDVSAVLEMAQKKLTHQKESFDLITKAIEKIGDHDLTNLDSLKIYGDVGTALINLQTKLAAIKQEESIRVWMAQGIAQISEVRKNNSEMQDYSFQIISRLTKYLNANQGAFYSLEVENKEQHL